MAMRHSFSQFSLLNTGQLSKRLRGNGLLSVLQRSGKCLPGASHVLCVLVEANYSFGILLIAVLKRKGNGL